VEDIPENDSATVSAISSFVISSSLICRFLTIRTIFTTNRGPVAGVRIIHVK